MLLSNLPELEFVFIIFITEHFGVVQYDRLSGDLETTYVYELQDKLVLLPYKETFILLPLQYTLSMDI